MADLGNRQEIQDAVIETVKEGLGLTDDSLKVTGESNLIDDLGADSLDSVEIVMSLEDKFGIEVDEEKQNQIHTINDIVNIICEEKGL